MSNGMPDLFTGGEHYTWFSSESERRDNYRQVKRRKTRETWRTQRNGTRKGKFDRDPVTLYESTLIHRFVLPLTSRLRLFSCRRKYRRQSLDPPDGNKLAKRSYVCDQRYVYWLCSLCMFFFSFFPFFFFFLFNWNWTTTTVDWEAIKEKWWSTRAREMNYKCSVYDPMN